MIRTIAIVEQQQQQQQPIIIMKTLFYNHSHTQIFSGESGIVVMVVSEQVLLQ